MLRAVSIPANDVRARKSPPPAATPDLSAAPIDLFEAQSDAASAASLPSVSGRVAELRFGQVGLAQLKLHSLDPARIYGDVEARVRAAPQLFDGVPVAFDLSALEAVPSAAAVRALIESVHGAGLRPVGLAVGDDAVAALARELDWPLFAKFRPERDAVALPESVAAPPVEVAMPEPAPAPAVIDVPVAAEVRPVGQHHAEPVRSGQRLYARGTDLTVAAVVGHGAEVIADGSIHIYGVLRGRALAGARGDTAARIYCQNFQAELVAIAGQYRVFEEPVAELHGKPVQAWLDGDKLKLAALS
ncbi:MAG TPA: septum site-determining protein MinC [Pseudomonadota bacterium]|nr:septum site-determining protein MinC [Pseudomonadota bacterium]